MDSRRKNSKLCVHRRESTEKSPKRDPTMIIATIEECKKNIKKLKEFRKKIQKGDSGYELACFIEINFNRELSFWFCRKICIQLKEKPLKPIKEPKLKKFLWAISDLYRLGAVIDEKPYKMYRATLENIKEKILDFQERIDYENFLDNYCPEAKKGE